MDPQRRVIGYGQAAQAFGPARAQLRRAGDSPAKPGQRQRRGEKNEQTVDCEHDGDEFTA